MHRVSFLERTKPDRLPVCELLVTERRSSLIAVLRPFPFVLLPVVQGANCNVYLIRMQPNNKRSIFYTLYATIALIIIVVNNEGLRIEVEQKKIRKNMSVITITT